MVATVTHNPKAGATLTGTEYEAADHHVVNGVALDDHNHDADYSAAAHDHAGVYSASGHTHSYEASGAVATHEAAPDPHPGYLTASEGDAAYSAAAHTHAGVYATAAHTHSPDAGDIPYDGTDAGLAATDVQAAIDEIVSGPIDDLSGRASALEDKLAVVDVGATNDLTLTTSDQSVPGMSATLVVGTTYRLDAAFQVNVTGYGSGPGTITIGVFLDGSGTATESVELAVTAATTRLFGAIHCLITTASTGAFAIKAKKQNNQGTVAVGIRSSGLLEAR